jgi:hypothetical protein
MCCLNLDAHFFNFVVCLYDLQPDKKITEHCSEIVDKWNELSVSGDFEQQAAASARSSIDTTLHSLIEQQTAAVPTCKQTSVSDSSHKQAILAQYAQMSDSEEYPFTKMVSM